MDIEQTKDIGTSMFKANSYNVTIDVLQYEADNDGTSRVRCLRKYQLKSLPRLTF